MIELLWSCVGYNEVQYLLMAFKTLKRLSTGNEGSWIWTYSGNDNWRYGSSDDLTGDTTPSTIIKTIMINTVLFWDFVSNYKNILIIQNI